MREFFKDWRRKVGCVLLVVACVLATSWVRSLTASDSIWIRIGDRHQILRHDDGRISWELYEVPADISDIFPSFACFLSEKPGQGWHTPLGYFESRYWMIPHSLIVLPLTLLSAYLVLWKPRKSP